MADNNYIAGMFLLANKLSLSMFDRVQVCYCLLMPSIEPLSEEAFEFQYNFVSSGGVQLALNMLTKNNFLPNADLPTRK